MKKRSFIKYYLSIIITLIKNILSIYIFVNNLGGGSFRSTQPYAVYAIKYELNHLNWASRPLNLIIFLHFHPFPFIFIHFKLIFLSSIRLHLTIKFCSISTSSKNKIKVFYMFKKSSQLYFLKPQNLFSVFHLQILLQIFFSNYRNQSYFIKSKLYLSSLFSQSHTSIIFPFSSSRHSFLLNKYYFENNLWVTFFINACRFISFVILLYTNLALDLFIPRLFILFLHLSDPFLNYYKTLS